MAWRLCMLAPPLSGWSDCSRSCSIPARAGCSYRRSTVDARLLAAWQKGEWRIPPGRHSCAFGEDAEKLQHRIIARHRRLPHEQFTWPRGITRPSRAWWCWMPKTRRRRRQVNYVRSAVHIRLPTGSGRAKPRRLWNEILSAWPLPCSDQATRTVCPSWKAGQGYPLPAVPETLLVAGGIW